MGFGEGGEQPRQTNLRTLQYWEQGRREPEEIARTYLRVIARHPDAVPDAVKG